MLRKFLIASIPTIALIGCLNESVEAPVQHHSQAGQPESAIELRTLETPVKIKVGAKSVTVYRSPDGFDVIESTQPKGEASLLTPQMSGKTWKEIAETIAPGSEVAPSHANEIYLGETGIPSPVEMAPMEGQFNPSLTTDILGKKAADAAWFQQNFCTVGLAFSWCLLNRWGGNDWGQTNAKYSKAHIIMNSGSQVVFSIKSGGKRTLTTTILNDNIVHWFQTFSSRVDGIYRLESHRYDITNSDVANNNWHWSCYATTW